MKIIDSHVHIYPDKIADKASQSIAAFYDMPVKYDGTITKLLEICERNNIDKCVVCSVAMSPEHAVIINNYIAETVNSFNMFIGLAALHPDMTEAEIETELKRAKNSGLRGIKLHPDIQQFQIDDRKAYKIYECASGTFPVLFHTGDRRFNFSAPKRLAKVLRDFPDLTAVGAHFGGWSEWEDVGCYEGLRNLYVDTCSSLYELSAERARELISFFGEDRVLFATDYPMWDADGELEYIERLKLSEQEKRLIFRENAERLYNIMR